jgi:hypothetical protein
VPRGIHNGLSDEHKKASGSFRPSTSEETRTRRLSEKIFAGPGFVDIPDPDYPFGEYGLRRYYELAGRLLKQGKLSGSTLQIAEQLAIQYEIQQQRASCGQRVSSGTTTLIMRLLALLKLTDDLTPVGGNVSIERKKNSFGPCGGLATLAKNRLREAAQAQI